MWPPAPAKAGLRFHPLSAHRAACLWAQALQAVQQTKSFCQVKRVQSENSLSKLFFFFFFLVYMVFPVDTFVLPKEKKKVVKTKAKSHPYVFSVSGSIFRDTFSTKLPELEMLIRSPTPLHHLSPLLGRCADAPWGCNSCSQCPHGSAAALNTLSMCCA